MPWVCIGGKKTPVLFFTQHNAGVRIYARISIGKISCVDFHSAQCWRTRLRRGSASKSPLTRSCVDSHRCVGFALSCIAQWTSLSMLPPSCIAQWTGLSMFCSQLHCTVNWFVNVLLQAALHSELVCQCFALSCIAQWTGLSVFAISRYCTVNWFVNVCYKPLLHSELVCQCLRSRIPFTAYWFVSVCFRLASMCDEERSK